MLHKRLNANSQTFGNKCSMPSKKLTLEEKMKVIYEYFQNHGEDLDPIPEELDKLEKNSIRDGELINPDLDLDTNSNNKIKNYKILNDKKEPEHNSNQIDDNFQITTSFRMEYIIDKSFALKILDCTKNKLNSTIPTKSLYRSVSLSSFLDLPSNKSVNIKMSPSICNLNKLNQRKNSSLASDHIDVNLRVLNNSVSLISLSSTNLTKSQSYFSCSKFQTGSNSLLNMINKCQNTNPLIIRTKHKIKNFENKKANSIASSSFIDHKIIQDNSYHFRQSYKSNNEIPEHRKTFNYNFKLDHFATNT